MGSLIGAVNERRHCNRARARTQTQQGGHNSFEPLFAKQRRLSASDHLAPWTRGKLRICKCNANQTNLSRAPRLQSGGRRRFIIQTTELAKGRQACKARWQPFDFVVVLQKCSQFCGQQKIAPLSIGRTNWRARATSCHLRANKTYCSPTRLRLDCSITLNNGPFCAPERNARREATNKQTSKQD